MSEIKVGEYVRTKKGSIGKFKFNDEDHIVVYFKNQYGTTCVDETEIVNHSFEPIDLIENGDILRYRINNLSTTKIGEVKKYKDARSLKEYLGVEGFSLEQIEILGIITKEQFENIEYKVVE